jgi:hypothetical protein
LIWHTRLQMEEYNLNQCARQLDICEAHLRRQEHSCDCREGNVRATRLRGIGMGRGRGSQ